MSKKKKTKRPSIDKMMFIATIPLSKEGLFVSQILSDFPCFGSKVDSSVKLFFKNFELPALARICGFCKIKRFPCVEILFFMIECIFTGKNLSEIDANGSLPCNRSTYYRFLANPNFNWRRLLLMFALKIRIIFMNLSDSPDKTDVLIVDDTLYERRRSKKVELLSRKHDHNKNYSVLGFEMLTIGWSDGRSFLPLIFSLLSSQLVKHRLCEANTSFDRRTIAGKLRSEAVSGKPTVLLSLLATLKSAGVKTSHILFDSWFSSRKLLEKLIDMKFRPICMVKEWKAAYFTYEGNSVTIRQLYSQVKDSLRFDKTEDGRLGSVLVGLGTDEKGKPRLGRVIFVRRRGKGRAWLALLTTDTFITDAEAVRLYGVRWSIEVFFKVCKSVLKLAKEYQVRSYDALVGQASLVMLRYVMLSHENRISRDERSLGELFRFLCEELADLTFLEAMKLLFSLLKTAASVVALTAEKLEELFEQFMADLPALLRFSRDTKTPKPSVA